MKNQLLYARTGNEQIDDAHYKANLITILDLHGHEIFPPHHRMPHQELLALIKKIKTKADQSGLAKRLINSKNMTARTLIGSYAIYMARKMNHDPRKIQKISSGIWVSKELEIPYLNNICHAAGCGCNSCWERMLEAKERIATNSQLLSGK